MKKRALLFPFSILLSLVLLWPAQETTSRPIKIKVTAEQANLREKPDIGSAIVQQIPEGTVLEADKKEGEWYLVRYTLEDGGVIAGYVHESLVAVMNPAPASGAQAGRETIPEAGRRPGLEPRPTPGGRARSWSQGFLPIDIFVSAGGSTVVADDFNNGAGGLVGANGALLGMPASGSVSTLSLTYLLGLEVSYRVKPWLSIGLGTDFLKGWRTSQITYAPGGTSTFIPETTVRPMVQAVPVKLSVRFYPRPDFYIRGSAVYYFIKAAYDYQFVPTETSWQEWAGKATAHAIGMEVAAGGEWGLTANLLIFAEAGFRMAQGGAFDGTGTYQDSDGASTVETGPLWYYQQRGADGQSYDHLLVHAAEPAGSDILGARKAALNLTGTTLKTGIKFRF
jgi:hypothetical protein